jgi:ZIP family zinc transporter
MNELYLSTLASLVAGLATVLGFIPLFFIRNLSRRSECICLSFSAGVMLAASFFSLLDPAFEQAYQLYGKNYGANLLVLLGFSVGILFLALVDKYVTTHSLDLFKSPEGDNRRDKPPSFYANLWVFILAIMVHNFPEGMAVGVGFSTGDVKIGLPISIGIALQNIPEGLVVAVACLAMGYSKKMAFLICLISGLVEPVGGVLGFGLVYLSESFLPLGLSFAAGAMLFAIIHKMMFEIHEYKMQGVATLSCMIGLIVMSLLDVAF